MKLELEIQRMKQEKRDQQNKEDFNSSLNMVCHLEFQLTANNLFYIFMSFLNMLYS